MLDSNITSDSFEPSVRRRRHQEMSSPEYEESFGEEDDVQRKKTPKCSPAQTASTAPKRTDEPSVSPAKITHEYQVKKWNALKTEINSHIHKLNKSNLTFIIRELFKYNIVRGRGLLAHSILQKQIVSPSFTSTYAALVGVINMNFRQIGELIGRRLISSFNRAYKTKNKVTSH